MCIGLLFVTKVILNCVFNDVQEKKCDRRR